MVEPCVERLKVFFLVLEEVPNETQRMSMLEMQIRLIILPCRPEVFRGVKAHMYAQPIGFAVFGLSEGPPGGSFSVHVVIETGVEGKATLGEVAGEMGGWWCFHGKSFSG